MSKKNLNNKGFSLIELVISIFVLSVGVVGVFGAFSLVTILTSNAADQLTAAYLAQEGMEIVRNMRDTNWLNMDENPSSGATWVDGLVVSVPADCTQGCEADYASSLAQQMNQWPAASEGTYLKVDPPPAGTGFYNYTSGTPTKFKRKIMITPITDVDGNTDHIVMVRVEVSWDAKATVLNSSYLAGECDPHNCVSTEGTLYNWYNYE